MIRKVFLSFTLTFIFFGSSYSQPVRFPEDFLGEWKGTLLIHGAKGIQDSVSVKIIWSGTENQDSFSYTIQYEKNGNIDKRPYSLIRNKENPQKYVVDEHNGIYLDMQLLANKAISIFMVDGTEISYVFTLHQEEVVLEVMSYRYSKEEPATEPKDLPDVKSAQIFNYQFARLKLQ
jgi:hypothetical protein